MYSATHRNGMRGAVKILHPHCVADEQLRTRFVREGYVANKIGHSGAVTVLDDDVASDGTVYLVMELLEGRSLERMRGDGKRMSVLEVLQMGDALLDVLAKAHDAGIIHRDIKPANLFITNQGQLKVLDFGIARLGEPTSSLDGSPATQTGLMMGTPAFMPPEQARARWNEVDARSDLWAVGATMIALILGRRPRVAETPNEELLMAMTQPMPKVATLMPRMPESIARVLDKAVEFHRHDRWPSALAMQQALREAMNDAIASAIPEPAVDVPIITATVVAPTPAPQLVPPSSPALSAVPSYPSTAINHGIVVPVAATSSPPSHNELFDQPPSLTTSRAVLHTAPPPSTGNSRALAVAFASLVGVALVIGGALYLRAHKLDRRDSQPGVVAAAPPPPPTIPATDPSPTEAPQVDDTPPETAPPSSVSAAVKGTSPPATPTTKRPTVARPTPSASANPAKYFDTRF